MDAVLPEERIDRQQRRGAERVLVARSEIESDNLLSLILLELVHRIRHLEPIAREQQIDMQRVLAGRARNQAVERIFIVADA